MLRPRSQAVRSLLTYGVAESIAKGLNWSLLAILPLMLASRAEYGIASLVAAAEGLGASVLLLGQDRSVLRFYHAEERRGAFLATSMALCALAIAPCIVALAWLGTSRTEIAGVPLWPHLGLLAGALLFVNLLRLHAAVLRVEESVRGYALLRLAQSGTKFTFVLALALGTADGLAYPAGLLASALVVFACALPGILRRVDLRVDGEALRRMLAFGWPLVFHVMSGAVLMFIDRFMLEHHRGAAAVGSYALAYSLGSGVVFLFAPLTTYFEPRIYRSEPGEDSERRLARFTASATLLGSLGGIAVLVALPLLLDRVYGSGYASALGVTPVVLAAHLIHPLYLQANFRLALERRTRALASGTSAAAISNVALNALLIPTYGELGAAAATLASLLLMNALVLTLSLRGANRGFRSLHAPGLLLALVGATGAVAFLPGRIAPILALAGLAALAGAHLARPASSAEPVPASAPGMRRAAELRSEGDRRKPQ